MPKRATVLGIKLLLISFAIFASCFSQDTIPDITIDSPINFFSLKPLNLYPYNNRVVPYNDVNPLYVLITYEDGKNRNFEYFRIDSSKYLVYEYFKSGKGSSIEGLKSSGIMRVTNNIAGVGITGRRSAGGDRHSKEIHHYKAFSKEGEWNEYEDSLFYHRYWTGTYINNKKVGVWSNYIYDPNEDVLIQQIDYDRDSLKKIRSTNLVEQVPTDSIGYHLLGRWPMSYDPSDDQRHFLTKCQKYDGIYGDDCNNRFGKIGYYEFLKNGQFKGQNGDGDKKVHPTSGLWKLDYLGGKLILEISSPEKRKIRYHIIYLAREGKMVADKQ